MAIGLGIETDRPLQPLSQTSEKYLSSLITEDPSVGLPVIWRMIGASFGDYFGDRRYGPDVRIANIKITDQLVYPVYIPCAPDRLVFMISGASRAKALKGIKRGIGMGKDIDNGIVMNNVTDIIGGRPQEDFYNLFILSLKPEGKGLVAKGHVFGYHWIKGEYSYLPEKPVRVKGIEKPDNFVRFLKQLELPQKRPNCF